MAIRQRVLEKVKCAYEVLYKYGSCDLIRAVKEAAGYLQEADGWTHKGIANVYDSKYKPIYNGLICAFEQVVSGMDASEQQEVWDLSQELLEFLIHQLEKEDNFKKEIVFLPYKASMWDSMESVWQAAVDDSDHTIAYVVPIPYFDRDTEGNVLEWHCEASEFPKYVPVINYQRIDLENMHPDVIVIQNPYDDYNTVTSVDMKYYSRNIKEYTEKLVYIPYFILEEPNPDDEESLETIRPFIFHGEGVRNANITIVQSENMREAYIRILVKYGNKDREYWEKRILGLGSPKIEKVLSIRRDEVRLPESWRRVIEKTDGTRKKVILYNVSWACLLEHKEDLLDKMEWVLKVFRERQDETVLLWRPHPLFEAMIKSNVPEILERYRNMVKCYRYGGWGIYDDSSELHRSIAVSDGYYGDKSSLVELFQFAGKPVMLQNLSIIRIDKKSADALYIDCDDCVDNFIHAQARIRYERPVNNIGKHIYDVL